VPLIAVAGGERSTPRVVSTSPRTHSTAVDPAAALSIEFDQPIDQASVTAATFRVFGRWSGPARGELEIETDGRRIRFVPAEPFLAGERVMVSVSRGIEGTDGTPLAHGHAWSFRVRTIGGGFDHVETFRIPVRDPGEKTVQTYGAYAGDLDDDGWSDLAIVNERSHDIRVYRNDGSGGFTQPTARYAVTPGMFPSPSEGADLNNDGAIDLVVAGGGSDVVDVLLGDGAGGFGPTATYTAGPSVRCIVVLDLDGDGFDDVVVASRLSSDLTLFRNLGDGTLGDGIRVDAGGDRETACAVADANGDGIQDVFVGALRSRELILLLGDGEGGLVVSDRAQVDGLPWMLAAGDVNGDGLADVVSANSRGHTASVALGNGEGGFLSVRDYPAGERPLAIDLGDLDGDGDLDMVASSYDSADFTVFENDGQGNYSVAVTLPAPAAGSCTVLHDRDNDGDLDITGIDEVDDILIFFENRGAATSPEG
jgi:hypothetical protein